MKKILACVTLFSLTICGAEFWEKKKSAEWNDKEVDHILKDSPWAHTIDVSTGSPSLGSPGGSGRGGGKRGGGGGADQGGGSDQGPDFATGGAGGGGGARQPTASIVMRWNSAAPIKL